MNVCPICRYKVISNARFDIHKKTHDVPYVEPVVPEVVETPKEVNPNDDVTLHFNKPVEIYINGVPYIGKDITVKNMSLAAEIVRIARDAYGSDVLA